MMTDQEIRLECLRLALNHGNSTDKIAVAREFESFIFNKGPVLPIRKKAKR